ncbi:MAG: iron-sulfur cluster assembly accessory protein [Alphaproteobacteria bacterium]|nr:iron-sulfur cluster assembly accessory protein [Alphaproteobacteria bacterium]
MDKFINITPAALDFIKTSIEREKCLGIRLDVKAGGCSGMTYEMEFINEPNSADLVIEEEGTRIYISSKSAIFVANMTMDYVVTPMGGSIVFENPNAKTKCACGKSFSTDESIPCSSECCHR